jgi:hypothetical protein
MQFLQKAILDCTLLLGSSLDRENCNRPYTKRVRVEGSY